MSPKAQVAGADNGRSCGAPAIARSYWGAPGADELRRQLLALLRARPGGNHRRAGGEGQLRAPSARTRFGAGIGIDCWGHRNSDHP